MHCTDVIIVITSLEEGDRHYWRSLHFTTLCALSEDDLVYITKPIWIPVRALSYDDNIQWSVVLLNDDTATDERTDLLVLPRYGFPIQCLVWFLFTKFVSCSFLIVVWHFFQRHFLNKSDLTYFFTGLAVNIFYTCQQYI